MVSAVPARGPPAARPPARRRCHDRGPLPRARRDGDLQRGHLRPALPGHPGLMHQRVRDRAGADLDHLVGAVLEQPGGAARADREPDPGPPAQPAAVTGQRLHGDLTVQPCDPPQLLPDHLGLEPALRLRGGVLPVASAAAVRAGMRARRLNPVRRGLQDLDRLRPGEPGGGVGDPGADPFARQRVPDEHHPAAGLPGHAPAAVRDVAHGQFQQAVLVATGGLASGRPDRGFHTAPMLCCPGQGRFGGRARPGRARAPGPGRHPRAGGLPPVSGRASRGGRGEYRG